LNKSDPNSYSHLQALSEKGGSAVAIVGGCGHVGLPLGVALANSGNFVTLIDINKKNIDLVNAGTFPFLEKNGNESLARQLKQGRLLATSDYSWISQQNIIIVTLGTPVDEFQSPTPRIFMEMYENICKFLKSGQLIILRSTVYPGTSEWLAHKLKKHDVSLAYCPERIVQGNAFEEFSKIPQIIAADTELSFTKSEKLFQGVSPSTIRANFMEAELAKLFLNTYRYIQFAIANEFFRIADSHGVNYENVQRIMTFEYPRGEGLKSPGLAAGPCLLKDTQQLIVFSENHFNLGSAAIQTNEGMALYLVSMAERLVDLKVSNIGLLGMAFKPESDDIRSSLSYKVRKMLQLKAKNVYSSDPFVSTDHNLIDMELLIDLSDIIIICSPHDIYKSLNFKNKKVINIWI